MGLRLALRRLRRQAGLSGAIVVSLAAAVAVTSALFSVIDGLLFRPLPFKDPDRLVAIAYPRTEGRQVAIQLGFADRGDRLRDQLEHSSLIEGAAQAGFHTFFTRDAARDLGLNVTGVDSRFFDLLGLTPAVGVGFSSEDERSPATQSLEVDQPLPIVISDALSRRLYGGAFDSLGPRDLAGRKVRVVGVMGPGVKFPGETNVWAPVPTVRNRPPSYARLRHEANVEQVANAFPELEVKTLRDATRVGDARALLILFAAALALSLVAWVQAAALKLFGVMGQVQEMRVRVALGAARARVCREFAWQDALIVGCAFILAWAAIAPLTRAIAAQLPDELQHGQYLAVDLRTLLFSFAASLLGVLLLTALPLAMVRQASAGHALSERYAGARRGERLRYALLVVQMTLTAMLLYLSGLAAHSFAQAATYDFGFDAQGVLVFTPPPWARVNTTPTQARSDFTERNRKVAASIEALQGLQGVVSTAGFFSAPLSIGLTRDETVPITSFDGIPLVRVSARSNSVGADFVRTLGAKVLAGHSFQDMPRSNQEDVTVINESLARRLVPDFGEEGPELWPTVVGHRIVTPYFQGRVIGVIKDLVQTAPAVPTVPEFFQRTQSSAASVIAIRVQGGEDDTTAIVTAALHGIWGQFSPRQLRWMREELDRVLVPYRAQSVLLTLIAALCLPIAGMGLVGALAYSVRLRTREIAIRLAIGANPLTVRRAVVRRALVTATIGIALGTALGAVAGRAIAHQLFQVSPTDPSTVLGVTLTLLVLGWFGAIIPARYATRIDPATELRAV
jgi:predicted permease